MSDETNAWPVAAEQGGGTAEELAYRHRQLQLTAEFGFFALKTHDTAALLQEATRVCALGLNTKLCKVMQYLLAENQFLVVAGVGWKPGVVGHGRAGADLESPAGYAFQTGAPVISNHMEGESRFRTPQILVDHDVKRAINVLIQGEGQRFGILEADSSTAGRFTEADVAFMQSFAHLLGVALERQQVEETVKASEARAQASESRLQDALAYQEVLTREISHRVKNSLSVVAGLLGMQARLSTDPELQKALADAETRVHTVAEVHNRLWRTDEVRSISLADFLSELCGKLRDAAGTGHFLVTDFAPVTIATDQAVPLGLLVNELITNAFKYAYSPRVGIVRISVTATKPGSLQLTVSDEGHGLPLDFDASTTRSLGMKLITMLSRQLGGQPEWRDARPGTRFTLDFVVEEQPPPQ